MSSLEAGIVGLPNAGKSTLWNALCGGGAVVAAHPFSTTESQTGNADVRDPRLEDLARVSESAKIVPATLRVVDVAGLVRGAAGGEGLGNAFLGQLRTTEALLHVVRCFHADEVVHPAGRIDPADDAETVELELVFADQAVVERRLDRVAKAAKGGGRDEVAERDTLQELMAWLEEGHPARSFASPLPADVDLLTSKPMLYVANVDDTGDNAELEALEQFASSRGSSSIAVNGQLEAEVAELDAADRTGFLAELGIDRPALDRVSLAAYAMLDLIPFFTTGPKETRAWTIHRGDNAQRAAGRIHSDLERGFIRAEVIEWDKLVEAGSEPEAKRRGWVRVEGRDYVVADGDVLNVRFNV